MPATTEERQQWRDNNPSLISFMETPANQSSRFVRSMYESFRQWGSLTPAQTIALSNVMREMSQPVEANSVAAQAHEAEMIPNGTFTITVQGSHSTFRIHTVRNGRLSGKRVVKRQEEYGGFKAFAFVTPEGTLKVWRSYYEDEAANATYILHARTLLAVLASQSANLLRDAAQDNTSEFEANDFERDATVQAAVLCRICNRQLTNPESITRGIGPECWSRINPSVPTINEAIDQAVSAGMIDGGNISVQPVAGTPHIDMNEHTAEIAVNEAADSLAVDTARAAAISVNPYGLTPCPYCHRDDFMQPQGRGRHISSCRSNHGGQTLVQRLEGLARSNRTVGVQPVRRARFTPTARQATAPRPARVNRSQLGTRIDGEVWVQ
jgi:hypothetical protein